MEDVRRGWEVLLSARAGEHLQAGGNQRVCVLLQAAKARFQQHRTRTPAFVRACVQVHTVAELERVLLLPDVENHLLGINNRDLGTFKVCGRGVAGC